MPYPDKGFSSRLPGVLANLRYGLFLAFQINPDTLDISKPTNYSQQEIPGQAAPYVKWTSGGGKTISFNLMFDRTAGGRTTGLFNNEELEQLGVLDIEAIFESFLYPRNPAAEKLGALNLFQLSRFAQVNRFLSPPELLFIWGPRWYRTVLLSAPFNETVFNKFLVPQRVNVSVQLLVLESGRLDELYNKVRAVLATSGSMLSMMNLSSAMISDLKKMVL